MGGPIKLVQNFISDEFHWVSLESYFLYGSFELVQNLVFDEFHWVGLESYFLLF